MKEEKILTDLEKAISLRDGKKMQDTFREIEDSSLSAEEILKSLTAGMEMVRRQLQEGRCSIPEFLLSVDVFREGTDYLHARSSGVDSEKESIGVVIGVVEGDVHDMGKNIIAAVLEASGYTVHDVGRDVSRETFLDVIEETGASLLALSTMMSTPQEKMREIIQWTRKLYPDVGIIVGGASLDQRLARAIGADGYAENAATAPEETERVAALKRPVQEQKPVPVPVQARTE